MENDKQEIDIVDLKLKMIDLEKEVSNVLAYLKNKDKKKIGELKGKISNESLSLIQTLLAVLN